MNVNVQEQVLIQFFKRYIGLYECVNCCEYLPPQIFNPCTLISQFCLIENLVPASFLGIFKQNVLQHIIFAATYFRDYLQYCEQEYLVRNSHMFSFSHIFCTHCKYFQDGFALSHFKGLGIIVLLSSFRVPPYLVILFINFAQQNIVAEVMAIEISCLDFNLFCQKTKYAQITHKQIMFNVQSPKFIDIGLFFSQL